jgi:hypothetical protein
MNLGAETARVGNVPHRNTAAQRTKQGGSRSATAPLHAVIKGSERLQIYRSLLATTIFFQFERDALAFVQIGEAGAFHGRDVHESIRRAIVALNEAEAFGTIEELHGTIHTLTIAHRSRTITARRCRAAFEATFARLTRRRTIRNRQRLAVDLQFGRRNATIAFGQGEFQRLTIGQTGQTGCFHCGDVHEHIFTAIFTHHKAEALLRIEEFHGAAASADDDAGAHLAAGTTATEAATTAAAAAAEATAAAAAAEAATITAAEAATITAAEATAATAAAAETVTAAAEAAATEAAAGVLKTLKTAFALVKSTAPRTTSASIKAHYLIPNPYYCLCAGACRAMR